MLLKERLVTKIEEYGEDKFSTDLENLKARLPDSSELDINTVSMHFSLLLITDRGERIERDVAKFQDYYYPVDLVKELLDKYDDNGIVTFLIDLMETALEYKDILRVVR